MPLHDDILREQKGWGAPDSLEFYRGNRNRPEDLYESERFFLPDLLPRVESVLDVGCAAGGFSVIMKTYNPRLSYTGVDITPELITIARRDHADCQFEISDGVNIPFPPESFDLVHCSGVLHLNSRYSEMIASMWAQARQFLLCDFRLTRLPTQTGRMEIRFGEHADASIVPYHILNVDEVVRLLTSLSPSPAKIRARGYSHLVSSAATVSVEQVIMAFFLLEKRGTAETQIEIQLDE